jgi:hypothetical protein
MGTKHKVYNNATANTTPKRIERSGMIRDLSVDSYSKSL